MGHQRAAGSVPPRTTPASGVPERDGVRSGGMVRGTTQDVLDDVAYCREVGIDQLTYDFRVDGIEDQMRVMEHLADRVLPIATQLG